MIIFFILLLKRIFFLYVIRSLFFFKFDINVFLYFCYELYNNLLKDFLFIGLLKINIVLYLVGYFFKIFFIFMMGFIV